MEVAASADLCGYVPVGSSGGDVVHPRNYSLHISSYLESTSYKAADVEVPLLQ